MGGSSSQQVVVPPPPVTDLAESLGDADIGKSLKTCDKLKAYPFPLDPPKEVVPQPKKENQLKALADPSWCIQNDGGIAKLKTCTTATTQVWSIDPSAPIGDKPSKKFPPFVDCSSKGKECSNVEIAANKELEINFEKENKEYSNSLVTAMASVYIQNDGAFMHEPALGSSRYGFAFINGNRIQRSDTQKCLGVQDSTLTDGKVIQYQDCGNQDTQKWTNPISDHAINKASAATDFLIQKISYYKKQSDWNRNVCDNTIPELPKTNCYPEDIPIEPAYNFSQSFPFYTGSDIAGYIEKRQVWQRALDCFCTGGRMIDDVNNPDGPQINSCSADQPKISAAE